MVGAIGSENRATQFVTSFFATFARARLIATRSIFHSPFGRVEPKRGEGTGTVGKPRLRSDWFLSPRFSPRFSPRHQVNSSYPGILVVAVFALVSFPFFAADAVAQNSNGSFVGDMAMVYDGFTQPRHEIMLASDETGRIESVDVVVGQRVKEGQVIARLERDLQVSALKTARIQIDMVGEMNAAKIELELNQVRAEKIRQLFANKMARPDELRRSEADLRIAKARVASLEEQLELRKVELQRAEVMLKRRTVYAPMSGVISEIFLSPGESISPSTPSIVELLAEDQLIAIFDVPVEDTLTLRTGAAVRVRLRSVAETIDASISSITPKIDGESGTVQVRVKLSNPDGRLLSGDRCTLQIVGNRTIQSAAVEENRWK